MAPPDLIIHYILSSATMIATARISGNFYAIKPLGYLQNQELSKDGFTDEAIRRSIQIPGGTCCYQGACGGAVSLGVAVSLISGATPLTGLACGMAHRATALALLHCGDDQARCCKRALRMTVSAGRKFFAEEFGVDVPPQRSHQPCTDISRNRQCAKAQCSYFHKFGKDPLQ